MHKRTAAKQHSITAIHLQTAAMRCGIAEIHKGIGEIHFGVAKIYREWQKELLALQITVCFF